VAGLARPVTQGVIIAPALGAGGRHAKGVTTPTNKDYVSIYSF